MIPWRKRIVSGRFVNGKSRLIVFKLAVDVATMIQQWRTIFDAPQLFERRIITTVKRRYLLPIPLHNFIIDSRQLLTQDILNMRHLVIATNKFPLAKFLRRIER